MKDKEVVFDVMMDVIKWWLNFLPCNFGLKTHKWFQFWIQAYDFIPKCILFSSITIIRPTVCNFTNEIFLFVLSYVHFPDHSL